MSNFTCAFAFECIEAINCIDLFIHATINHNVCWLLESVNAIYVDIAILKRRVKVREFLSS